MPHALQDKRYVTIYPMHVCNQEKTSRIPIIFNTALLKIFEMGR